MKLYSYSIKQVYTESLQGIYSLLLKYIQLSFKMYIVYFRIIYGLKNQK